MNRKARLAALNKLSEERIIVLNGAWGSLIQTYNLSEEDFRGTRFAGHPLPLKGNNDILCLTRPDVMLEIHHRYLEAGADITTTNTFSCTTIAQADYGLEGYVDELNIVAANLARQACDESEAKDGRMRFVAAELGPTNKTLSLSPDVNDPARRDVTFEEVVAAYKQQTHALIGADVDIILIETIFDTLNAKAAIFAVEEAFDDTGERLPVMISGTITDRSGRTLSGQTVEAFWHSVRQAKPWSVGLNCALGTADMEAHIRTLARIADTRISTYPNAGLPNAMGGYDETPQVMADALEKWAADGVVNIIGGCCGTTPDHIRAFAKAVQGKAPHRVEAKLPLMRLSGLEPFVAAN